MFYSPQNISLQEYNSTKEELLILQTKIENLDDYIFSLRKEMETDKASLKNLTLELNQSIINSKTLEEKIKLLVQQKQDLEAKQESKFQDIANKIFLNNTANFGKQTSETLNLILSPLKEKLDTFQTKIDETREKQLQESTSLKEQISQLQKLNQSLTEEASNLAQALHGNSKTRGTWGEIILEKLIEKSGLTRGIHYEPQVNLINSEEERLQPDFVIYLPENKNLIIDSKVSLLSYENYCSASSEEIQRRHLREHIHSLQNHIKNLSKKNYQNLYGINSPDFILLFVPIEPAFTIAIQNELELYQFAIEKNIVLVTPSTLLATLRIIYNLWRQESQNKNVLEIARQSGLLYDKFVGFLEDLKKIGSQIEATQKTYTQAMGKLYSGKGSLIQKVESIKSLGAKNSKSIPEEFFIEEGD